MPTFGLGTAPSQQAYSERGILRALCQSTFLQAFEGEIVATAAGEEKFPANIFRHASCLLHQDVEWRGLFGASLQAGAFFGL